MDIIIDPLYKWKLKNFSDTTVYYVGYEKSVDRLISFIRQTEDQVEEKRLNEILTYLPGNFAVIIDSPKKVYAIVDRIISYPIFYCEKNGQITISNSARKLQKEKELSEIDNISLLEFRMAGYVTGRETICKNLYQLQAGETLLWNKSQKTLNFERYYLLYSENIREENEELLIEEFNEITNKIFKKLMADLDGSPIWVPLSGGYDSRFILCKLMDLGYDDLTAYTYGPTGNYEAKAAKYVADKLKVKWHFLPSICKNARKVFNHPTRKSYWRYADFLKSVPAMHDFQTIFEAVRDKMIPENATIIVGHTGDFISGGHIPQFDTNQRNYFKSIFENVYSKHYTLWTNFNTDENCEIIKEKFYDYLNIEDDSSVGLNGISSLYECWEWQERQCKYVINGQRRYDYFNLGWRLPLWEPEYTDFWTKVPLDLKINQRLYINYLEKYNLYNLFKGYKPYIWRWPGITIGVPVIAKMIKTFSSKKYSDKFYQYLRFWGHYRNYYYPYGFRRFARNVSYIRNPVSLHVDQWLSENISNDKIVSNYI